MTTTTTTSTTRNPPVRWAQRKDSLFVTIDLQGVKDPALEVTAGKITFKGEAQSHGTGPETHSYVLDLNLYDEINTEDVKESRTDRTLRLLIGKKESGPFWPRLVKEAGKVSYIKTDFDRWVDEDEEEEAPGLADGFDMSQFAQMMGGGMGGGMGGDMGGFDMSQLGDLAGQVDGEGDSDEEEDIPELTK
ncbi:MAG: p23/wos2 family protein [bacterium]|mmetsp:Transcript_12076/g.34207  ORF Transcript_12076/g.34207 Transcript_12076/m.34207 type:complete len:190 (+) Transcript_12076:169-738(+)